MTDSSETGPTPDDDLELEPRIAEDRRRPSDSPHAAEQGETSSLSAADSRSAFKPLEPYPDEPFSFSTAQLAAIIGVASIALAVIRLLPIEIGAGLIGLFVLVSMFVLSVWPPSPTVQLGWFVLLAIYIITGVFAVMSQ